MAASLAPFLDGVGGRLARSKPQLEDDASATDLQNNGRRRNQKHTLKEKEEIRTWLGVRVRVRARVRVSLAQPEPGVREDNEHPESREDDTQSATTTDGGGGTNRDNQLT
jgi:hypothetical protein